MPLNLIFYFCEGKEGMNEWRNEMDINFLSSFISEERDKIIG